MSHPDERNLGAEHLRPSFTAAPLVEVFVTTVECVVCGNGADDGDTCEDCGPSVRFDPPDTARQERLRTGARQSVAAFELLERVAGLLIEEASNG